LGEKDQDAANGKDDRPGQADPFRTPRDQAEQENQDQKNRERGLCLNPFSLFM